MREGQAGREVVLNAQRLQTLGDGKEDGLVGKDDCDAVPFLIAFGHLLQYRLKMKCLLRFALERPHVHHRVDGVLPAEHRDRLRVCTEGNEEFVMNMKWIMHATRFFQLIGRA